MSENNVSSNFSNEIKLLEVKAWGLLQNENFDEAIKSCDEIFKKDSDNVAAFQAKIASLRKNRDISSAIELLEKAIAAHPNHPGILSERAWLFIKEKKYEKAISAFDEVLKFSSNDPGIFLWQIFLLRDQGRFEEAKILIEKARHIFPENLDINNELGWLYFYQRQYDEAIEIFKDVLSKDPRNDTALQGEIASHRMKGQYAEATRLADTALSYSKKSPGIYSERAWINFIQCRFENAERDFNKVLSLVPNDPFSHINLAWSLVRQGSKTNLEDAIKHCREAIKLEPELANAFGCLGNIAFKRGYIREAETYFLRSIEVNSIKGHYADLGALYNKMGQYEKAKENLQQALKIDPHDAYAHMEMGNLYLQTDKAKYAIREFRMASVIDPKNSDSFNALAIALMENNKSIEAEKVLRDAIRKLDKPKLWELHLTLCRLLTRIGDETNDLQFYEEALKEVSTAIRLNPQNPEPYFHGGIVRFKLNDHRMSLNQFRRCLSKDEYHFEAELNSRRVRSLIRREKAHSRISVITSAFLALILLLQLVALWFLHLRDSITETTLTVLVPTTLGLLVVATLLPWLTRLKLVGLEAELSVPTPKESLQSGPKGEIGFFGVLQKLV